MEMSNWRSSELIITTLEMMSVPCWIILPTVNHNNCRIVWNINLKLSIYKLLPTVKIHNSILSLIVNGCMTLTFTILQSHPSPDRLINWKLTIPCRCYPVFLWDLFIKISVCFNTMLASELKNIFNYNLHYN